MPSSGAASISQISAVIADFRDALETALTAKAQESVNASLGGLAGELGGVEIEEVEFEVTLKKLVLRSRGTGRSPAAPSRQPAKSAGRAKRPAARRRSRAPRGTRGMVRGTLLGAFDGPGAEMSTEALREHLEREGVQSTTDNMHQQLGRLVRSGELERAGRGVYRLVAAPAQAADA